MPRVRLFGPIAEAAGTKSDNVPGGTLDEVLAAARNRYGDAFSQQLPTCHIWINGEVAQPAARLRDADEVAVLPPVSGG